VKTSYSVLALCAALSSGQALAQSITAPATIEAGIFDLTPTLSLDTLYNDNITKQPESGKHSSVVTVLTPGVQAVADNGEQRYTLGYEFAGGSYASSSVDNYADNRFNAGFDWTLNHRNKLSLSADYFDGHEDRGVNDFSAGAVSPDELTEEKLGLSYTYGGETSKGRLVGTIESLDKQYTNNREVTTSRDREDLKAGATFYWRLAGATDLLLEATQTDIDYVSDPAVVAGELDTLDSELNELFVGVTWLATGKTTGTVKVGQTERDYADTDRENSSNTSWDVNVIWSPKIHSSFTFTAARKATESSGNYIDGDSYGVEWNHQWSNALTSKMHYTLADEDQTDLDVGRTDDLNTYGVRVDYAMRRWLSVGVSFDYSDRDSNRNDFDYENKITALHLSASL